MAQIASFPLPLRSYSESLTPAVSISFSLSQTDANDQRLDQSGSRGARNLAIDVIRKSAREINCDDALLTALPDGCPTALETIEIREEHNAAVDIRHGALVALEALDPTKRHLVMAAYIDGESRDQLSERYGVPVNTIKTRIRRALIEIRSHVTHRELR